MRKFIYINVLGVMLLLICSTLKAQQRSTSWQLSLGGGFMNYYGDVSPYRIQELSDWQQVFKFFQYNKYYVPKASFGVSLEKRFTPTTGIMIQANKGSFAMSDRYRNTDGSYDQNAPHWNRALNFKTNVFDAGLALAFHADNGHFLYSNSFFAPYFFIGAGATYFKVKGDLYDSNGNPYDYTDPNVQPDENYETKLRPLMTENNKKYAKFVPYADLGIGIKLRLSRVVSLTIQSDIKYSFSDQLDDVSGKYKTHYSSPEQAYAAHPGTNLIGSDRNRGYDNGVNDIYIFNKASLQFSLGSHRSRHHFNAPIVFRPGLIASPKMMHQKDILAQAVKDSLINIRKQDSLNTDRKQDSLKHILAKNTSSDSTQTLLKQLKTEMQSLRFAHIDQDYLIRQNETRYKIASLKNKRQALGSKRNLTRADSLQMHLYQIKIDSLTIQWKAIQKAREQLRRDMAQTPIISEYADSTKIMIYKGKETPSENYLPLIGTPQTLQNTDTTGYYKYRMSDTSKGQQTYKGSLQQELDSLQRVRDSLLYSYQSMNDTSRVTQLHTSQLQDNANIRDSIKRATYKMEIDSLQKLRNSLQLTYLRQSIDSLQRVNDSLKNPQGTNSSKTEKDLMQVTQLKQSIDSLQRVNNSLKNYQGINSTKTENDSLKVTQLGRSIDSLQRVRDSIKNNNQDTEANQKDHENFVQRLFSKSDKNKESNNNAQDTIAQQQQESRSNQKEIDRSLQEAQLRRSIDSLQRVRNSMQNNNNYQDTTANQKDQKNFVQRLFSKSDKNKESNDNAQDTIAQQQQERKSNQKEIDRSLQEAQLRRSIDSLQRVRNSLQNNNNYQDTTVNQKDQKNFVQRLFSRSDRNNESNNNAQDTIAQQQQESKSNQKEIDRSRQEQAQLKQSIDSLQRVRNSIQNNNNYQDTTVNQKEQKAFVQHPISKSDKNNESNNNAQDTLTQQESKGNQKEIDRSRQEQAQLKRSIDSLQRIRDLMQNNNNYQDTTVNQKHQKAFVQQPVSKARKSNEPNNNSQDIIDQQQQQIKNNQRALDRLNDELNTLKNNNQQSQASGFSDADRRRQQQQERSLQQAIDNLNRNQRRNRVQVVPTIAPVIRTGKRNNKNYDRQLEVIQRKLDSLQAKESTSKPTPKPPSDTSSLTSSDTAMKALHSQIDSLKNLETKEQVPKKDTQLTSLRQQVDSLNRQIAQVQNAQTATAKEKANDAIINFPVISTYFATGSSTLSTAQINKLRPAAAMLKSNADVTILLKGFTDATGSARINQIIAEKRGQAVKDVFVNKFNIDPSHVKIDAIGETGGRGSDPMARRVDVRLEKNKK